MKEKKKEKRFEEPEIEEGKIKQMQNAVWHRNRSRFVHIISGIIIVPIY